MSSTQKRGFRLPWAAEHGPDEGADAATNEATELEPVEDTDMDTGVDAETNDVNEGDARLAAMMMPALTKDAAPAASAVPETTAEAEMMDTESATSELDNGAEAEEDAEEDAAEDAAEDAEEDAAGGPWPSSDRPEATDHAPEARAATRPFQIHRGSRLPRRDNPLVAGLVKAMREAALASRAETTNRLQTEATARIDAIRADATTDAAALRKRVDDDIAGIREWSKGEMARIRAETEGRIETRRADAIAENKVHLDGVERLVDEVQSTVSSFEADMDQFFKQLLAETDPARLATLAGSAPEPPDLSGDQPLPRAMDDDAPGAVSEADEDADESEVLEADAAAEAEAEATEGLDMAGADPWPAGARSAARRGDDSEAGQHGSGHSRLLVNGLSSVADISAFKAAVGQLAGVSSVSVSSGERGMFIFNVNHDPEADLASAIAGLSGFAVEIMEASGDSLTVTAHQSAA